MSNKVFIGMSGGVDSSVAAFLLKQNGYEVTGVTMRLFEVSSYGEDSEDFTQDELNNDPAPNAVDLARSVADKLGINFITVDYRSEFKEFVIEPFIDAYEKGLTPNPCIECNRCLKFEYLLNDSDEGYEGMSPEHTPKLATGHYAVIEYKDGRWVLRKSRNLAKDQSYFLYSLSQEVLSRTIFPLGDMDKDEVREIAERNGLINARRKDSQDICFIPDGDYYSFIKNYTGREYPEGNFVDIDGNILGRHKGIIKYTIGQRKGLGLALKQSMYVYRLDLARNEVVLAYNDDLFKKELTADSFNWVSMPKPSSGVSFRALGRIRYRHKESPCTITVNDDGSVTAVFDEAQRAITAGQSLVLYDIESDSYVLGGGIIK